MRTPVLAPIKKGVLAGKNVSDASPDGCAKCIPLSKESHNMAMQRMMPIEVTIATRLIVGEWILIPAPKIEKNIQGKRGYVPVTIR
jgi:hypothetical protein